MQHYDWTKTKKGILTMREFIINNCAIMIWCILTLEAIFAVLLGLKLKKDRSLMTLCMLLIDIGLFIKQFSKK